MGYLPALSSRIFVLRCALILRKNIKSIRYIAVLLAIPLLGCTQTGDFGRPRQGVLEQKILPFTGSIAARLREEPVSLYALTEDEKDMRARAWHFLMPEQDAPAITQLEDHAAYHRLLPARQPDVTLFHRTIMGGGGADFISPNLDSPMLRAGAPYSHYASLTSRYNRVKDAIMRDQGLIPPFRRVAAQVIQADHTRFRALEVMQGITPEQRGEARARICENSAIIHRVHWAFYDRAAQYRYSLEHLIIEGPEREAIPAERSLMALERDIGLMNQMISPVTGAGCNGEGAAPPALQSRPLSRKG